MDLHGNPTPASRPPPKPKPSNAIERLEADRRRWREGKTLGGERKSQDAEKRDRRTASHFEHMVPAADRLESTWRHSGWKRKRALVRAAMERSGSSGRQMEAFDACGALAYAQWSETLQKRRLSAFYCHCRHCEPCARAKAGKIVRNLREKLIGARKHEYRFFTLTLAHSDRPLSDQVKFLYASFKKLRKTQDWKRSQQGGCFMLEIKHNGKSWHPHLHGVVQGRFLQKQRLSELWKSITQNSYIVDVRELTRPEDAAHYVSKYVTKSTHDSVWATLPLAIEFICATRGLRACNTFGSWRKFPLLQKPKDPKDWQTEDSLVNLLKRSAAGDRVATDILATLKPPHMHDEADVELAAILNAARANDFIDNTPAG